VKAATSRELRAAFERHLEETEGQIERWDKVFEILGKSKGVRSFTVAAMPREL
jgi:ferritin-like metal-binding protein YciE